ncbi:glycosyltransferase involved in cell wall biosynthesis [Nonlabens dokdonensis]|jgi:glycosyltransferase involved in cell wall biosynthesis|uniref:Glycosyl transferase family 2 n=2 Tax=Nonlabens dokdonensis TaxID=328515 RepID=L7WB27_NONDD|nr:glycosyltransferase [Nonlabens dokdonensis]AGC77402.1 glycosyl transferase family 2 [Nonlabens dokdonensis DSW-6]PZX40928.1 glycosyltransferase involved in cell wall biosynthesis [Nonlabens dokdonensis]
MKISVYITSYNQVDFLTQAITSVLNQTLQAYEIIIIDDCSSDGSRDVIESFAMKYPQLIRFYFNEKNIGITKTRNKAISLITGDYLTWLDGDDIFKPNKLEIESKLLKETNSNLVYSNFYYSNNRIDEIFQIWCTHIDELPKNHRIFKDVISRRFPKGTLFRYELVDMKLIERIGSYDEKLDIYEDFDFRIRTSQIANTAFTLEPLSVYRIHDRGLSRASKKIHLKNLSYIFSKYKEQVIKLSDPESASIQDSIKKILGKFENLDDSKNGKPYFKARIKNKLIKLINKF